MPSCVIMGRRRPSWSGRGKARRRLTGQRVVADDAVNEFVVVASSSLLYSIQPSRLSIVLGGWGIDNRKEPGGSPFLVGCAFLFFPSGSHEIVASSVIKPARC